MGLPGKIVTEKAERQGVEKTMNDVLRLKAHPILLFLLSLLLS
jgi:hypothetical protein